MEYAGEDGAASGGSYDWGGFVGGLAETYSKIEIAKANAKVAARTYSPPGGAIPSPGYDGQRVSEGVSDSTKKMLMLGGLAAAAVVLMIFLKK